jgi:DNA topoisomerase-1
MARNLVIVESPAKARTIEKFLGKDYRVEASIGHIRDLPERAADIPAAKRKEPWARLGVHVEGQFEPLYVIPADKKAHVKTLKAALAEAEYLYLATDEDREGESISWHLLEVLKPKVPVKRLVFHEITKTALERALANPRDVDMDLVEAQETRRILDRLVGYQVSPLLWRKIRPQLSAGRVQSVALRLVVVRERERMAFTSADWWDVLGGFRGAHGDVDAAIVSWKGKKVARGKDFSDEGVLNNPSKNVVLDEASSTEIGDAIRGSEARVVQVEEKPYQDKPAAPFTTSTLQQEANRKLKWTARRTMNVAQRLYQTGWITYMRTDSVTLSQEAIAAARSLIKEAYGDPYLPSKPRLYKSKAKNAQEAHEAIRPAGAVFRTLRQAESELERDEARLFTLIWKRTVASQMANAEGMLTQVRIEAGDALFGTGGKSIRFPGFRRAYVEGADDPGAELMDAERLLPTMTVGEGVEVTKAEARGHQTEPPRRLTEATLIKELEAKGIGRPSTYASIISKLQSEYLFKKGSALVPQFTAFAVITLLEKNLPWLVDYDFTARMEARLDDVALGQENRIKVLDLFYFGENGLKDTLETAFEKVDARSVCTIPLGVTADGKAIDIRVGKWGPFLSSGEVTADIPEDTPPDELSVEMAAALLKAREDGPRVLGTCEETDKQILLCNGRFGAYVQLGEPEGKTKPKRASLLKGMEPEEVDLEMGLKLLSLPRDIGPHPRTEDPVVVSNGRYGPYVKSGDTSRSLAKPEDLFTLTMDEAVVLLDTAPTRGRKGGPQAIRTMGPDPKTEREVKLMAGRYGPYVTDGKTNASLPKAADPDTLDLAGAIELIRKKEGAPKRPRRTRRARGS